VTTAALVLASVALAQVQAPAPPVFEARVDSVYVDAFVVRDGAPVAGLTAANFELKDDGAARQIELVGVDSVPLVSLLAFDVSDSVKGEKLRALQEAGASFLSELRAADEAGLMAFNQEVAWQARPTADKAQVERALMALQPRGGTALYDGLFAAVTVPDAAARPLVVVFSDGEDTASWLDERRVKTALARSNALVHIVGLVPDVAPEGPALAGSPRVVRTVANEHPHARALRQLAEATGGRFWPAGSTDRLKSAFAGIAEAMRRRYLLRFEPAGGAPGWHRLQVKLKGGAGEVQARPGYWAR
jgi:VWFA-related protein